MLPVPLTPCAGLPSIRLVSDVVWLTLDRRIVWRQASLTRNDTYDMSLPTISTSKCKKLSTTPTSRKQRYHEDEDALPASFACCASSRLWKGKDQHVFLLRCSGWGRLDALSRRKNHPRLALAQARLSLLRGVLPRRFPARLFWRCAQGRGGRPALEVIACDQVVGLLGFRGARGRVWDCARSRWLRGPCCSSRVDGVVCRWRLRQVYVSRMCFKVRSGRY